MRIQSYGARAGFWARVHLPRLTSWAYLKLHSILRRGATEGYIRGVLENNDSHRPLFINIETLNRCNGRCAFCPANVNDERRPYKKMTDALFEKIVDDLAEMDFTGVVSLYVNNEPFLDKRMSRFCKTVRQRVPKCHILLFTNGTLITPQLLDELSDNVDTMYINNYSASYALHDGIQACANHVNEHKGRFQNMEIIIQRRYSGEYLTNRAGTAPNKAAGKPVSGPCIMPFTDFTIYPDGAVGLCCNDTQEATNFGNVNEQGILEIFQGKKLCSLRKKMGTDRGNLEFCRNCDVIDSGIRLRYHSTFSETRRSI